MKSVLLRLLSVFCMFSRENNRHMTSRFRQGDAMFDTIADLWEVAEIGTDNGKC